MYECIHHLQRAIDIQNEQDTARRLDLLDALKEPARAPVLAWLWADAERGEQQLERLARAAETRYGVKVAARG